MCGKRVPFLFPRITFQSKECKQVLMHLRDVKKLDIEVTDDIISVKSRERTRIPVRLAAFRRVVRIHVHCTHLQSPQITFLFF